VSFRAQRCIGSGMLRAPFCHLVIEGHRLALGGRQALGIAQPVAKRIQGRREHLCPRHQTLCAGRLHRQTPSAEQVLNGSSVCTPGLPTTTEVLLSTGVLPKSITALFEGGMQPLRGVRCIGTCAASVEARTAAFSSALVAFAASVSLFVTSFCHFFSNSPCTLEQWPGLHTDCMPSTSTHRAMARSCVFRMTTSLLHQPEHKSL
jgi:hypothetical protein